MERKIKEITGQILEAAGRKPDDNFSYDEHDDSIKRQLSNYSHHSNRSNPASPSRAPVMPKNDDKENEWLQEMDRIDRSLDLNYLLTKQQRSPNQMTRELEAIIEKSEISDKEHEPENGNDKEEKKEIEDDEITYNSDTIQDDNRNEEPTQIPAQPEALYDIKKRLNKNTKKPERSKKVDPVINNNNQIEQMMIEISSTSNDISTPGHGEARKCQTEKKENDQEKQEK